MSDPLASPVGIHTSSEAKCQQSCASVRNTTSAGQRRAQLSGHTSWLSPPLPGPLLLCLDVLIIRQVVGDDEVEQHGGDGAHTVGRVEGDEGAGPGVGGRAGDTVLVLGAGQRWGQGNGTVVRDIRRSMLAEWYTGGATLQPQ